VSRRTTGFHAQLRQIAFGVFVTLLFVIGGLVQIAGMLP
jgi:hypothetical protein